MIEIPGQLETLTLNSSERSQDHLPPNPCNPVPSLGMKRRSLLQGAAALAIVNLIAGCQGERTPDATIQLLQNSIPTPLLREFQTEYPSQLIQFRAIETLASSYDTLTAENSTTAFSPLTATVLGDFWLTSAIRQNLITPLPVDELDGWSRLPSALKQLVTRNGEGIPARNGRVWGAPYRLGSLAIAYNTQKFASFDWTPEDWSVLWRPELQSHISLPDSARIVIGLALKSLNESWNAETVNNQLLSESTQLINALQELHQQVKLYSSSDYLQPLILGDTWLAVGWTTDILPLLRRDRRFAGVIPESGTLLTADVWVRPNEAAPKVEETDDPSTDPSIPEASPSRSVENIDSGTRSPDSTPSESLSSILQDWIQFCWQPSIAQRLSLQGFAASPVLIGGDRTSLPNALRNDPLLLPDDAVINKSEFLAPLPDDVLVEYQKVWTTIRLESS
ncbi:MAG: extracellular solute-binding protein [Leptolyngbyaceae bacterium]|nr:extracellular solute-binding protein [Leptolyngbyaceae bacterium]